MEYVLIAVISAVIGAGVAVFVALHKARRVEQQRDEESRGRVAAEERNSRIPELETQLTSKDQRIASLQAEVSEAKAQISGLTMKLAEQEKAAKDKLALLEEARQKLSDAFKALSAEAPQGQYHPIPPGCPKLP